MAAAMVATSAELQKRKAPEEELVQHKDGDESKRTAMMQLNSGLQMKHEDFSRELLRVYYDKMFPYRDMFRWLSYKNDPKSSSPSVQKDFFLRREFTLVLEGDIYCRYTCFKDADEYRQAVMTQQPVRMEIGAVFSHPPKLHKAIVKEKYKPVERELVFDIDMDDYDDIRTCCTGAKLCTKCWNFMKAAIKTLRRALIEDFGFKHILFVYSGRRGVHCWVCDSAARKLSNDHRSAVAEYLTVVAGGSNKAKADITNKGADDIHPSIAKAHDICKKYFRDDPNGVLQGQDIFKKGPHLERIADILGTAERTALETYCKNHPEATSLQIWDQIEKLQEEHATRLPTIREKQQARNLCKEVCLQYSYPRLDINVSKQMNHLLKSPFVVHPKTGRVCVPIDPDKVDDFNPLEVPTLGMLAGELETGKNSLKQYTHFFQEKFLKPLEETCKEELKLNSGMDF